MWGFGWLPDPGAGAGGALAGTGTGTWLGVAGSSYMNMEPSEWAEVAPFHLHVASSSGICKMKARPREPRPWYFFRYFLLSTGKNLKEVILK